MYKVTQKEFKDIMAEGIKEIPKKFLEKLDNVAIILERKPTLEQLKKLKIRQDWILYGLYEGIPQNIRGSNYTMVLPDKITIFRESIEKEAANREELKEIIKNTIWHEIAHHFGLDEKQVRSAEERRRKKISS